MTKLLHSKGIWWFFATLTVFVYLYGLGIPLLGPDEPRYAQVAREMFERGDWITPTLGGFHWFEKPALLYWLQIAAYNVFGVSEFAARLGSALCGLGTIFSLWLLARYTFKDDRREAANWVALIPATTLGILVFSRGASFDIIVTFPLTASLAGFFIFDQARLENGRIKTLGLFAFYFFAGASVLAKGLIGVVFPFAIVGFYFLLSRRLPTRRFFLSLVWGSVVIVLVAAVWNLPMYLRDGWEFIDEFYIQHHFQRFTSNKYRHPQPFYFFLWVLPLMTLPWLPWFFAGLWHSVKEIFQRKDAETQGFIETEVRDPAGTPKTPQLPYSSTPLLLFAFAWILVPLVFFSLSGSKLPAYILPAVPGTVLLTGTYVFQFVQKSDARRGLVFGVALATLMTMIVLLSFVVPKYADADSVERLIETADANGYSASRVVNFRTLSHNAEFYAAGRLVRNSDGTLMRFDDPAIFASELEKERKPILALVPLKEIDALPMPHQRLADNGKLAIVALTGK